MPHGLEAAPSGHFSTTNASKARVIEVLALAFERVDISIPNAAVLAGELVAYQAEWLSSGRQTFQSKGHEEIIAAQRCTHPLRFGGPPLQLLYISGSRHLSIVRHSRAIGYFAAIAALWHLGVCGCTSGGELNLGKR